MTDGTEEGSEQNGASRNVRKVFKGVIHEILSMNTTANTASLCKHKAQWPDGACCNTSFPSVFRGSLLFVNVKKHAAASLQRRGKTNLMLYKSKKCCAALFYFPLISTTYTIVFGLRS